METLFLSQNVLSIEPGSYRVDTEKSFRSIAIAKQCHNIIISMGMHQYYFDENGEFMCIVKASRRVDMSITKNNELLDFLMELLRNGEYTRLHSM